MDELKPITADDIKRGLFMGVVRLRDGYGDTVCCIGCPDEFFYFGGVEAEGISAWQYMNEHSFDEIIDDIVSTLEDFREELPDEWKYYRYVLNND